MPTFTPIASSTFTGGDETPLSEGGNWATEYAAHSAFRRVSNQVNPANGANDCSSKWVGAGTWSANQYSRATLAGVGGSGGGDRGLGFLLRQRPTSEQTDYYRFNIDHNATTNAFISRIKNGVKTALDSWLQTFTDGDVIAFAVEDFMLYVFVNAAQVRSVDDSANGITNTYAPGLWYSSTSSSPNNIDDWDGGIFATDTPVLVQGRRLVSVMQVPG